ncbi:MAG: TRAP transporter substrate-binding protein DctP [Thermodesulfobacteriota bacterium]
MKRVVVVFCFFMLASSFVGPAYAAGRPDVMIKLATLAPRGSEIMNILEEMKAEIRDKTDNEVGFKVYYGGVQGDEKDVLRKVRMGQLHGGSFTGHGLGRIVPQIRVTELPYLFRNNDEVAYVRRHLQKEMEQRFRDEGYVVLGWNPVGFVYNFSKTPIASIEVARQQKWWMWEGDPLSEAVFEAFDITPVPLSFTEVMTSLSTKMIDTASTTPYGAVAFRWYTRFDYMDEYPITHVIGATIISRRIWEKISPGSRAAIEKLAQPYFERMRRLTDKQNEKSIDILKEQGIEIVPFQPDENTKAFIFNAAKTARRNLVGQLYSQQLLDRTLALLDEYRSAHPDQGVKKLSE